MFGFPTGTSTVVPGAARQSLSGMRGELIEFTRTGMNEPRHVVGTTATVALDGGKSGRVQGATWGRSTGGPCVRADPRDVTKASAILHGQWVCRASSKEI